MAIPTVTLSLLTPLSLTGTSVLSANSISSEYQNTSRSTSRPDILYHPGPATVVSPLDYCNSLLPGLSDSTLNPLSAVSTQWPLGSIKAYVRSWLFLLKDPSLDTDISLCHYESQSSYKGLCGPLPSPLQPGHTPFCHSAPCPFCFSHTRLPTTPHKPSKTLPQGLGTFSAFCLTDA